MCSKSLKISILIFFILFSSSFTVREKDIIYWRPGIKLSWNDFKEMNRSGNTGAVSSTGIEYKLSFENNEAEVIVQSFFSRKNSWVKKGQKHTEGLKHEQGHFDISEIFARKLRKYISTRKFTDAKVDDEMRSLYHQCVKELGDYQVLYDKDTDHHRNEAQQLEWDKRIEKELKELKDFSETHLKLNVQ